MKNIRKLKILSDNISPILITLGSAAVYTGSRFYYNCIEVLNEMNIKSILLVGKNKIDLEIGKKENFLVLDYLPYEKIFNRCRIIVNQGGVGTIANVMRSGKPMLGIPFSHDQPDNCFRIKKLGMGEILYFTNFSKKSFNKALNKIIIKENLYAENAKKVENLLSKENGVKTACDCIEKMKF